MYGNIKSLSYATRANIVLQGSCTSKQRNSWKKISGLWLLEAGGGGRGNWIEAVKRYTLPVNVSAKDVMYNTINTVNTVVKG